MGRKTGEQKGSGAQLPQEGPEVLRVPWDWCRASALNKRRWKARDADDAKLVGLAGSIAAHSGNFEPIILRPHPEDDAAYEIVAGERRWRAVRLLAQGGLPDVGPGPGTVLALVRHGLSDEEAFEIMMDENRRRENLSPLEEMDTLNAYIETHPGWGIEGAAAQLGVSVSVARRRLRLGQLTPAWQEVLVEGSHPVSAWGAGHLELVAKLSPWAQDDYLAVMGGPGGDELDDYSVAEIRNASVVDVRAQLSGYYMALDEAPWALADETFGHAPACAGCRQRTDAEPDLFEVLDFVRFGTPKPGARCLDRACFKAKQAETWRRQVEEAKKKHPGLLVCAPWQDRAEVAAALVGESIVEPHGLQKAKKGATGAVPVLHSETGKVEWAVMHRPGAGSGGGGRVAGEPVSMDVKREKLGQKRRTWLAARFSDWLDAAQKTTPLPRLVRARGNSDGALALVFACGTGFGGVSHGWWCEARDNGEVEAEKLGNALLAQALDSLQYRLLSMASAGSNDLSAQAGEEELRGFCDVFGLDWSEEWSAAVNAVPEPKSWGKAA